MKSFIVWICFFITLNFISEADSYDRAVIVDPYVYLISGEKRNWYLANQYCRIRRTELLEISNVQEHQAAVKIIRALGGKYSYQDFWTSGTDLGSEDNFYWMATGRTFTYLNWCAGNPSNTFFHNHNQSEQCVQLRWDGNYRWNDHVCEVQNYFICRKKKSGAVTLIASQTLLPCLILIGLFTKKFM